MFMTELEQEILNEMELRPYWGLWWRYIDEIFFYLGTWRKERKELLETSNYEIHSSMVSNIDQLLGC